MEKGNRACIEVIFFVISDPIYERSEAISKILGKSR